MHQKWNVSYLATLHWAKRWRNRFTSICSPRAHILLAMLAQRWPVSQSKAEDMARIKNIGFVIGLNLISLWAPLVIGFQWCQIGNLILICLLFDGIPTTCQVRVGLQLSVCSFFLKELKSRTAFTNQTRCNAFVWSSEVIADSELSWKNRILYYV